MEAAVIDRFCSYLRIKTVHPKPAYEECTAFLIEQAKEMGLSHQVIYCVPGKPIVILTWTGSNPELASLLLNSHTDVVPVFEDKWTVPPFDAVVTSDGRIIARGAQDMKCVGSGYLEAVRHLKAKSWHPKRTIHLLFVPDEEIGGKDGMALFVHHSAFKALNPGFLLDEGLVNTDNEMTIYNAERSPWWIHLKAEGVTGHGSQLFPGTATEKLIRALAKVSEFRESQVKQLDKVDLGDLISVNVTMLTSGVQMNVIPEEAVAGLDVRIPPHVNLVDFERDILSNSWASEQGMSFTFSQKSTDQSITVADTSAWYYRVMERVLCKERQIPIKIKRFRGATDARFVRAVGVPALGFTPIRRTPVLLHDHDEFITVDAYLEAIDIYAQLIEAWCNE